MASPTVPPSPDSKLPVAISLAFVAVGLIIGLIGGFTSGSWAGGRRRWRSNSRRR